FPRGRDGADLEDVLGACEGGGDVDFVDAFDLGHVCLLSDSAGQKCKRPAVLRCRLRNTSLGVSPYELDATFPTSVRVPWLISRERAVRPGLTSAGTVAGSDVTVAGKGSHGSRRRSSDHFVSQTGVTSSARLPLPGISSGSNSTRVPA